MPYFQINMTGISDTVFIFLGFDVSISCLTGFSLHLFVDGTLCDLNEKPRITRVLYVCYHSGKHEVYSFKETSICEYEAIVLSQLLCEHPKYK